ncbi:MAG: GH39 family glycosyl hydrolase, partial [Bacteroidota bacterium]
MNLKSISVIFGIFLYYFSQSQNLSVNVNIDFSEEVITSSYLAGLTHTQRSIDSWGNSGAIRNAKLLLDSVAYYQNQHIMGWGTLNPWPDSTVTNPDSWNWSSLDRRISLMRETNGVPVITLCGAPTWMHTPSKNGETDWSALEKAPTKDHYNDFAHLCAVIARRYSDVLHYQVWNEFKGFYNASKNRWDYENYTVMYNMIYDSIKAVNPEIQIGGPYVVMDSWSSSAISHPSKLREEYGVLDQRPLDVISYWLQNKKGAGFITIDGGNRNKDDIWLTDGFKSSQKFVDVINWIRQQPGGEFLPVWWAEWYTYPENYERGTPVSQNYLNAYMAAGMTKCIIAGYETLLIWQPQGDASGLSFPLGIWTNTEISGGGKPTAFYYTQKGLNNYFSKGTKIYHASLSQENVLSVLASDTTILLVNQLNENLDVTIEGFTSMLTLSPYEVRFIHYSDLIINSAKSSLKST